MSWFDRLRAPKIKIKESISKKKIVPPESPKIDPKIVMLFALKEVFLNIFSNGLDTKLTKISM